MSMDKFIRAITANIGAKIISIFFAVFLWLHVTAQQEEKQAFRVPLALSSIPDSLTIIHDVPGFVDVTIQGARSNLLRLRLFGRLKASVDLSMAKKGRVNMPLSAAILNLSKELDPRNVFIDNPKTLSLNFESVIRKSVPVKLAYKGEIPRDVIITGQPVIIPDKVRISGAASVVGSITFLTTEEIDIRNRKGRQTLEAGLDVGGREIKVTPGNVLIEMEINKRAVRTLANIPPTLLQDNEELSLDYSPRTVSLTIEGPEGIIRSVVADDVSVILNIMTKSPGRYRLQPEVIVPQGVERYWLDIDAFEITIHPTAVEESKNDEKE